MKTRKTKKPSEFHITENSIEIDGTHIHQAIKLRDSNATLTGKLIHTIEIRAIKTKDKEMAELKEKLSILRRYHAGDGTITRRQILKLLGDT